MSASRTRNRYRVRLREPVRDPSASFASSYVAAAPQDSSLARRLTSLRMTLRGIRLLCKGLPWERGEPTSPSRGVVHEKSLTYRSHCRRPLLYRNLTQVIYDWAHWIVVRFAVLGREGRFERN